MVAREGRAAVGTAYAEKSAPRDDRVNLIRNKGWPAL